MAWVRGGNGGGQFSLAVKCFLKEVTLQNFEWWGVQRSREEPARPREQLMQGSEARIRMVEQIAIRMPHW